MLLNSKTIVFQSCLTIACIFLISCRLKTSKDDASLNQWILDHEQALNATCDSVIKTYHQQNKPDPNWTASSVVFRNFAPGLLGALALKAGDSNECIVVELTFYNDTHRKRNILIAAEDSSCVGKLKTINLKLDSTNKFIFGIKQEQLY